MSNMTTDCAAIDELADYWLADLPAADAERIEAHVFACPACALRLASAEALTRGIATVVRSGRFHAFVTDALLNRLARDGVRVRTYSLDPGDTVHCAVWDDDDVLVARLRADFNGVRTVGASMRLDTGEEVNRFSDVPVRDGAHEVLMALSAAVVRASPAIPMRVTLTGTGADATERVLSEYVFDHAGAFDRADTT